MSRRWRQGGGSLVVLAAGLLVACTAPPDPSEPPDPTPDPAEQGPCGDIWGPIPESGRLYVDAAAEPEGDGSLALPLVDLTDAIGASRATGIRSIALDVGEYPGDYEFNEGLWGDSGLEIAGCGRDDTELVGVFAVDEDGQDRLQPVVEISGAETADIVIRDLALVTGRRSFLVRGGAGSLGPIVLQDVDIEDSFRLGVFVLGASTVAHFLDVEIAGVSPEVGTFGWGVLIRTEASPLSEIAAPVVMEGTTVRDTHGVGIVATGAWLEMTASSVEGVSPWDGELGRGVHLENQTRAVLDTVTITDTSDTAVFLHRPGRQGFPVALLDCVLLSTAPAAIPNSDETSGDGLSIGQGGEDFDPAAFLVEVSGTEFGGNPRTHILAEAVHVDVGANNIFGDGTVYRIASQLGAAVTSDEEVTVLDGDDILDVNRTVLGLDAPE